MRCRSCASDIPESSRFCLSCGAPLESPSGSPTQTHMQGAGSQEDSRPERFPPGTLLAGRYRIVGLLGRGGMGEVYRADDLKLGHPVALKFLPQELEADPARRGRFLNEVRLALRVTHRNVCRVHDIGETEGQPFLSMEYVDGENLASLLRRIGRFPEDRATRLARQLCGGLAAAHEQGILHRDLKPANVMIDGRGQVKVTDFGLAGIAAEMQGPQVRVGTPAYMAPEQHAGREVTVRSDVYALGLVLYELYTGKPAFEARTPAERSRRQRESTPASPASLVDGLDPAVERVILRCLETDPALRPASALAVAAALPGGDPIGAALAAGETPSPELLAEAGQSGGLSPALAWAGLAAVVLGTGLVVLLGQKVQLVSLVPIKKPPDALVERAREISRTAGYDAAPADSLHSFQRNEDLVRHLDKAGSRLDTWAPLRRSRPAGLLFWYRESPRPLSRFSSASQGDWFSDPPNNVPGMVQMALDPEGRLNSFTAVPPEREAAGVAPSAPDWGPILAAAGLGTAALRESVPSWSPPVYADRRAAWEGVYPEAPDVPIHVEAAAFEGRPVWFRIYEPWTESSSPDRPSARVESRTPDLIEAGTFLAVLIGAAFLALRNVRAGRGDRRTALRFALYMGGVRILWLLGAHHIATEAELPLFVGHLAYSMYRVGLVWLFYMALEPYARRLWPSMLVSWVRLFGGRARDPLVGRDILAGASLGVAFALNIRMLQWLPGRFGLTQVAPESNIWGLEALRGLRHAVTATLAIHTGSVLATFMPVMLLLVFRLLFRRTWPAVVLVTLVGAVINYPSTGNLAVYAGFMVITLSLFWVVFFRFGLLSTVIWFSISDLLTLLPTTFDFSAWYAGASLPALILILGMTGWAFRTSLAGRPLFRDTILEAEAPASR
jgi:serine/threonine-protein kinase